MLDRGDSWDPWRRIRSPGIWDHSLFPSRRSDSCEASIWSHSLSQRSAPEASIGGVCNNSKHAAFIGLYCRLMRRSRGPIKSLIMHERLLFGVCPAELARRKPRGLQ
jgi:hypothetical protein